MDIVLLIKETIALQNSEKKGRELTQIGDVFEYWHNLKKEDVVQGTELLLAAALQEEDKYLKENFLRAISMAVGYYDEEDIASSIDWDALVSSLPSLEKVQTNYVLDIVSLTGEEKYLSIIENYAQSTDSDIKRHALYAITELKGKIDRAATTKKDV